MDAPESRSTADDLRVSLNKTDCREDQSGLRQFDLLEGQGMFLPIGCYPAGHPRLILGQQRSDEISRRRLDLAVEGIKYEVRTISGLGACVPDCGVSTWALALAEHGIVQKRPKPWPTDEWFTTRKAK